MEEAEASVDSHSPSHRVAVTWNHKLGHMLEQGMNILMERKLLPSLTKVSLPFCEHYVISKQHRLKFKTSNSRSISVLELVHSNVWQAPVSPWEEQSILYPSLIIIPRDVGCTQSRKSLRNQRQFTTTYTPRQNRVAERMNRTLLERARAMLATTSLRKSFWVETINTECYVINHSPSTIVKLKTPMEMWTRKPVPTAHKVVVSRDVVFMEDKIQENEKGDITTRETTSIQMEKEFQSNDSFEVAPKHEVNETNESQAPATRTLYHERKHPRWHSDYVIESNIAYG
ncbi:gag-pol polyprotein [Tanacetum coccineum]